MLYKHTEYNYAKSLLESGEFWIGTLFDYRDKERHVGKVLDQGEGTRTDIDYIPYLSVSTIPGEKVAWGNFVEIEGNSSNITFSNVAGISHVQSEDLFIYSMSASSDPEIGKALDPKYDACVKIIRPRDLFPKLTRLLPGKAKFLGIEKCRYSGRKNYREIRDVGEFAEIPARLHPAVIKPLEDAKFREVRAIWSTDVEILEPLLISEMAATEYLRS